MILKSELKIADVAKALETISTWCYFNRCDTCPLYQYYSSRITPLCALLGHIPSEYDGKWMYDKQ